MNDSLEHRHAATLLAQLGDEERDRLPEQSRGRFSELMKLGERRFLDAFLLCAAREPDQLTLWRGYGGEVSYAIELDPSVALLPVEHHHGDSHPFPPQGWGPEYVGDDEYGRPIFAGDPDTVFVQRWGWGDVRYDDNVARDRVAMVARLAEKYPLSNFEDWGDITSHLNAEGVLAGLDLLQLKHPSFKDEREARCAFDVNPRWKFVRHRVTRFGLTQYIEVSPLDASNTPPGRPDHVTKPAERLPIRSVLIGPTDLGDEVERSLAEFLEFQGYPDVPVVRSAIPFR